MRKSLGVLAVLAVAFLAGALFTITRPAPAAAQTLIGGFAIAQGTLTLDGSNPSSATTGLVSITACTVAHKSSAAPADDPDYLTTATNATAGQLDVYAWKNTGGTDPTLLASTDAVTKVDWICIGTK